MELKQEGFRVRLGRGNYQAGMVMKYLNHRTGANLIDYNGSSRDKKDGEDFGCDQYTFQCKVRANKDDIISESDKFIPGEGPTDPDYIHVPGRDARTLADFTIVKPCNQNQLVICTTESLKKVMSDARKRWNLDTYIIEADNGAQCEVIRYDSAQVREMWNKSLERNNFSIMLHNYFGLQAFFKIEEGDRKPYGKILFYIPYTKVKGTTIDLREGEDIYRPESWQEHTGESLDQFLPA